MYLNFGSIFAIGLRFTDSQIEKIIKLADKKRGGDDK